MTSEESIARIKASLEQYVSPDDSVFDLMPPEAARFLSQAKEFVGALLDQIDAGRANMMATLEAVKAEVRKIAVEQQARLDELISAREQIRLLQREVDLREKSIQEYSKLGLDPNLFNHLALARKIIQQQEAAKK